MNCHKPLLAGKSKCLRCGQMLGGGAPTQGMAVNSFVRDEEQAGDSYKRRTEWHLTDTAIVSGLPAIWSESARGTSHPLRQPLQVTHKQLTPPPTSPLSELLQESSPNKSEVASNSNIDHQPNAEDYFSVSIVNGQEELTLTEHDYKGKTKKDQQQRFILLYAKASEAHFAKSTNKETVFAAAKKQGLHNQHFLETFKQTVREFFTPGDAGIQLHRKGVTKADAILLEMQDKSVAAGFDYISSGKSSPRKRSVTPKSDEQKINEWATREIDLGRLDVRDLRTSFQQAAFALWCITVRLRISDTVSWHEAHRYITTRFGTVTATAKAFENVMNRHKDSEFRKSTDGKFCLTTNTQTKVETWIQTGIVQD